MGFKLKPKCALKDLFYFSSRFIMDIWVKMPIFHDKRIGIENDKTTKQIRTSKRYKRNRNLTKGKGQYYKNLRNMKKGPVIFIFLSFSLLGSYAFSQTHEKKERLQQFFEQYKSEGAFILYDINNEKYVHSTPALSDSEFLPASTFKIFNALVALETGVVADSGVIYQWDSVERSVPVWNKSHSLASGMKYSVVWYYQELARRIGVEKMQRYLSEENYGNQAISTIDIFWLDGSLTITPKQQVDFLKLLYEEKLGFSTETQRTVKQLILQEENGSLKLYGKTGWGIIEDTDYGWYVGILERGEEVYCFATILYGKEIRQTFGSDRINITKDILKDLNLYE